MRSGGRAFPPLALAALLLTTALLYLAGLPGPALLDDRHNLMPLLAIDRGELSLMAWLLEPGAGGLPRALPRASFWLDWRLHGDALWGFKLTNLLLHLLCGVLLYRLVQGILGTLPTALPASGLALFVTGAWLLSPLLVSTVLYTVQRMAQLSAVFCLLSLTAWLLARTATLPRRRALAFATSAVCGVMALLSKQNAAVLLPMLWLMERLILHARPGSTAWQRTLLAVMGAGVIAFAAAVWWQPSLLLEPYSVRDFSLAERLLTQPRVLADYAANLLLLPLARPMGLFHDDLVASSGLLSPPTTAAALLLLLGVVAMILRTRTAAWAPVALGLGWFIAAHAVESTVFGLELYFEHRNYLPAVGLFLALAVAADRLHDRLGGRTVTLLIILVLVASGALTGLRAALWRSELGIYTQAVRQHPDSARAHLGLSALRFNAGDEAGGRDALARAAQLLPPSAGLGIALNAFAPYCASGAPAPPWAHARLAEARAIGHDFYTLNAMAWFASRLHAGGCHPSDRAALARALERLAPGRRPAGTAERRAAMERNLSALWQSLRPDAPPPATGSR